MDDCVREDEPVAEDEALCELDPVEVEVEEDVPLPEGVELAEDEEEADCVLVLEDVDDEELDDVADELVLEDPEGEALPDDEAVSVEVELDVAVEDGDAELEPD